MTLCKVMFDRAHILQTPPISNFMHLLVGGITFFYPIVAIFVIAYGLIKLQCVQNQTFQKRLKSMFEVYIGYLLTAWLVSNKKEGRARIGRSCI